MTSHSGRSLAIASAIAPLPLASASELSAGRLISLPIVADAALSLPIDAAPLARLSVPLSHPVFEDLEFEQVVLADRTILISLVERRIRFRQLVLHVFREIQKFFAEYHAPVEFSNLEPDVRTRGLEART